ncbi:MAG: HAD-IA family hydrolase [Betaproteobacteria bacterium]
MTLAVLFDLDGTLADTAPDLGGALNRMRGRRSFAPLSLDTLRPHASSGARGLIGAGFGIAPGHSDYEALRVEFLEDYEANLMRDTVLFDGVTALLDALEARQLFWGIVTNKIERFTLPLVGLLGLDPRAGCVVCGDTTPYAKPHPAPLLEAARRLDLAPDRCVYVGDDERDIKAARSAGMGAIAAGYGYLGNTPPQEWGADHIIQSPGALLEILGREA